MSTSVAARHQVDVAPAAVRLVPATTWTVVGFALLALVMRLPFLATPMSSDEGGFLYVAQHWGDGGGSLYGPSWVDRPPLLIMLFRLADLGGGLVALRVLGCLAAAVTVLGLGLAVHRLLGPRAATWSAAAACLTITAPLLGAVNVNGELLATPFVALGILSCVQALTAGTDIRRLGFAVAAGVSAAAAVMVKQNVLDVVVFAGVLAVATTRWRRPVDANGYRVVGGFVAGAGLTVTTVLGAASALGTHPGAVFFAMYPFRLRAAGVMGHLPLGDRIANLEGLGSAWLMSGAPLVLVALVVTLAAGRLLRLPAVLPLALATTALAAYDLFSVAAGGSYWSHYLVQLVPVTALAAGLLAASSRAGRALVAAMLTVCGLSWAFAMPHRVEVSGQTVGEAIRQVAQPDDTVVSLLGAPDVVEASGLRSPYRYLWSLPSRTLDPRMTLLAATFTSDHPATWVVVRGSRTFAEIERSAAGRVLTDRYQRQPDVCGRQVYLRDGVDRTPPSALDCHRPLSSLFGEHQPEGGDR